MMLLMRRAARGGSEQHHNINQEVENGNEAQDQRNLPAGRGPLRRHDEARQKDGPKLGSYETAGRFPRSSRCWHVRGLKPRNAAERNAERRNANNGQTTKPKQEPESWQPNRESRTSTILVCRVIREAVSTPPPCGAAAVADPLPRPEGPNARQKPVSVAARACPGADADGCAGRKQAQTRPPLSVGGGFLF